MKNTKKLLLGLSILCVSVPTSDVQARSIPTYLSQIKNAKDQQKAKELFDEMQQKYPNLSPNQRKQVQNAVNAASYQRFDIAGQPQPQAGGGISQEEHDKKIEKLKEEHQKALEKARQKVNNDTSSDDNAMRNLIQQLELQGFVDDGYKQAFFNTYHAMFGDVADAQVNEALRAGTNEKTEKRVEEDLNKLSKDNRFAAGWFFRGKKDWSEEAQKSSQAFQQLEKTYDNLDNTLKELHARYNTVLYGYRARLLQTAISETLKNEEPLSPVSGDKDQISLVAQHARGFRKKFGKNSYANMGHTSQKIGIAIDHFFKASEAVIAINDMRTELSQAIKDIDSTVDLSKKKNVADALLDVMQKAGDTMQKNVSSTVAKHIKALQALKTDGLEQSIQDAVKNALNKLNSVQGKLPKPSQEGGGGFATEIAGVTIPREVNKKAVEKLAQDIGMLDFDSISQDEKASLRREAKAFAEKAKTKGVSQFVLRALNEWIDLL